MPAAGRLRGRVRFERRARSVNVGGVVRSSAWTALGDPVRAEVRPVRGGEAVQAARLAGVEVFEVVARGSTLTRGIVAADRIVELVPAGIGASARVLSIKSISNPDQRGIWLHFLCEADDAQDRGASA